MSVADYTTGVRGIRFVVASSLAEHFLSLSSLSDAVGPSERYRESTLHAPICAHTKTIPTNQVLYYLYLYHMS